MKISHTICVSAQKHVQLLFFSGWWESNPHHQSKKTEVITIITIPAQHIKNEHIIYMSVSIILAFPVIHSQCL